MSDLTDRVALVTGASRGIGRDIAISLARAGCHVAVGFHKDESQAEATVEEIRALGRRSTAFGFDAGQSAESEAFVQAVVDEFGSIGVVVNNAGINTTKPLNLLTTEDWDETIRTNLSSAFFITQASLPVLRAHKWGRIIMLSSVAAQTGGVIGPHYAASKAGLIGLAHSYAHLLAKEGITANAIAPALIETDMIKNMPTIKPEMIPVGRFGHVNEVAAVAVMLASNPYITGQTINVNGGWYMQ
jgi:3-oxoacyl-[acyl-carrier protein] reductase